MAQSRVREIPVFRESSGQQHENMPTRQTNSMPHANNSNPPSRAVPIFRQSCEVPVSPRSAYQAPDPVPDGMAHTQPTGAWSQGSAAGGRPKADFFRQPMQSRNISDPQASCSATSAMHSPGLPADDRHQIPVVHEPPFAVSQQDTFSSPADRQSEMRACDGRSEGLSVEAPHRGRSPSPAPPNLTALELIEQILVEAEKHTNEVAEFCGKKSDKQYLVIEEMLTRLLIKLDRIDSEGKEEIRNARREAVRIVQASLDCLEAKATAGTKSPDGGGLQMVPFGPQQDDDGCDHCMRNDPARSSPQKNEGSSDEGLVKEMTLNSEVAC